MDLLSCFFLTSGLFLGWSMGANDAANLFGTAVGSRMVKFKTAALVASIFVILGAVLQGSGTTQTLTSLGAVDSTGGAFTVALCAGIVVTLMVRYKIPVSTSQAIVGAIVGWCFYTSTTVDYSVLLKIVSAWILSPVLGCAIASALYWLALRVIRNSKVHILKMETIIRILLIVAGALAAFSLGANNIANVMGIFVNSFSFSVTNQFFTLSSTHILFLLGGFAIALGIFTYSSRVIETIGQKVLKMTPIMAVVVVLTQAVVLFLFSSSHLAEGLNSIGLPALPLVPVSSTQVVVGALLGIGLVKSVYEIKFNTIGNIFLSWIITPVAAAVLTFFALFFVQHTFSVAVAGHAIDPSFVQTSPVYTEYSFPFHFNFLTVILFVLLVAAAVYLIVLKYKNSVLEKKQDSNYEAELRYADYSKALNDIEIKSIRQENDNLLSNLEQKKEQLITYSLSISEHRKHLETTIDTISKALTTENDSERERILSDFRMKLQQKLSYTTAADGIYLQAKAIYATFLEKLKSNHSDLTENEIKLLILLRVGLTSKEIAPLLNISAKSVDINRHRLRQKLHLDKEMTLTEYMKKFIER